MKTLDRAARVAAVELRNPFLKAMNEAELLKDEEELRGNFLREIVEGRAREEAMAGAIRGGRRWRG